MAHTELQLSFLCPGSRVVEHATDPITTSSETVRATPTKRNFRLCSFLPAFVRRGDVSHAIRPTHASQCRGAPLCGVYVSALRCTRELYLAIKS